MPQRTEVKLSAIRTQLSRQIKEAERAVDRGTAAVQAARSAGKKAAAAKNAKTLARARKMLRKLEQHQASIAGDCCNKKTMNCDFIYE